MLKLLPAAVACVLFAAPALASDNKVVEKPLVAQTLDGFMNESNSIRAGMQPGGRYEFLQAADKARIETDMAAMQSLLQARAAQNGLSTPDKVSLANAQEEVNSILKHNDSNRLVCESRAPTGSHLPVTTCRTFGQIEQRRRESIHDVGDLNNLSRTNNSKSGTN